MIELSTLYDAVMATPEDDFPRMVYADRCEELGDTDRANFIRASISAWNDKQRTIKPPRGKGREWAGKLMDVLPGKTKFKWRRGFLAEFELASYEIREHLPDLVKAYPLEYITVFDMRPYCTVEDNPQMVWSWTQIEREDGNYGIGNCPRIWFQFLKTKRGYNDGLARYPLAYRFYSSQREAEEDLSQAVLTWARQRKDRR